ncbi:Betaine aldehyde dehydrogenase [Raoultella terrigena]|uniref:Betaine aldehyde dehydrogenase n=1 Tax=Raoultella terrigena TaxID=577 RepID=A0A485CHT2_RAOTE|nr:Betaine aldehyde dehydrogenase [Raoultella terrigena]
MKSTATACWSTSSWLNAKAAGCCAGGEIPADPALAAGSYFQPTIVEGLTNAARACREEIFGPVLVAMSFSDEDALIQQANDSVYGLAARDLDARQRTRSALKRSPGSRNGVDQHLQGFLHFDPIWGL